MEKKTRDQFDQLDDRVYALEYAYMALAKSLHQAGALDLLHLAGALQDLSAQLRMDSIRYHPHSPNNQNPVADQVDSLLSFVASLQSSLGEMED